MMTCRWSRLQGLSASRGFCPRSIQGSSSSLIFGHVVAFSQLLALLLGQRSDVGLPAGAPVGVPTPEAAQNRSWVVVVFGPEFTGTTIGICHDGSSYEEVDSLQYAQYYRDG
jgi:hypothetical protein